MIAVHVREDARQPGQHVGTRNEQEKPQIVRVRHMRRLMADDLAKFLLAAGAQDSPGGDDRLDNIKNVHWRPLHDLASQRRTTATHQQPGGRASAPAAHHAGNRDNHRQLSAAPPDGAIRSANRSTAVERRRCKSRRQAAATQTDSNGQ